MAITVNESTRTMDWGLHLVHSGLQLARSRTSVVLTLAAIASAPAAQTWTRDIDGLAGYEAAEPIPQRLSPEALKQVRELLRSAKLGAQQSCSLAIVVNGQVVLEEARNARPETPFPIASLTKAITAAAVLEQVEGGKLEMEQPIDGFFPATKGSGITIEHLLAHTSGLPDYLAGPLGLGDGTPTPSAVLVERYFATGPRPTFAPGLRCEYSNTNYVLLGRILELVTEEDYGAIIANRVLAPLELGGPSYPGNVPPRVPPPSVGQRPAHPTWAFAAGGLVGTAREVALLNNAIVCSRLLSRESTAVMLTPRAKCGTEPYACGYFLAKRSNFPSAHHSGRIPGYTAEVVTKFYPDDPITVVLLTSVDPASGLESVVSGVLALVAPDVRMTRWIHRATENDIDDEQLAPDVALAIAEQNHTIAPQLEALGELRSISLLSAQREYDGGVFQYRAAHGGGAATWTMVINREGTITGLAVQP